MSRARVTGVILPLLWAAGYDRREIISRVSDAAGKYPDYTILPNTSCTWYLEAKPWQGDLQNDRDLDQALSYAHRNSKRWVLLTNGREWRLYDDHIYEADARLVAQFDLKEQEFLDFMLALSKASVQAGEMEQFANISRLKGILQKELTNPDSPLINAMSNTLENRYGIISVQLSELARYFRENLGSGGGNSISAYTYLREVSVSSAKLLENAMPFGATAQEQMSKPGVQKTLEEIFNIRKGLPAYKAKPLAVSFPDGYRIEVAGWKGLDFAVISWLGNRHELPIPFRCNQGSERWFLNTQPEHENNRRKGNWAPVDLGGRKVYFDYFLNAQCHVENLYKLCKKVNEAPSEFIVELNKSV